MTYASLNSPHHMGEYLNIVQVNGHVTKSMKSLLLFEQSPPHGGILEHSLRKWTCD